MISLFIFPKLFYYISLKRFGDGVSFDVKKTLNIRSIDIEHNLRFLQEFEKFLHYVNCFLISGL